MNLESKLAALALGLASAGLLSLSAGAQLPTQPTKNLRSNNVTVDYLEPRDPKLEPVYQRLKNRKVLEQFAEFFAPLRLPVTFRLKTKQCNVINAFYENDNSWAFSMCYEIVDDAEKSAPTATTPDGLTRGEFIVGSFVSIILHETGHALSDILKLPVLGREEDSADQISGYFMLQFGQEIARATIKGTYYMWMQGVALDSSYYWDVHSTSQQRALNYLCLGYGKDPAVFQDFVDRKLLPEARAKNCAREYRQVEYAFNRTIKPFIDEDLFKKNQQRQWLKPEDFQ